MNNLATCIYIAILCSLSSLLVEEIAAKPSVPIATTTIVPSTTRIVHFVNPRKPKTINGDEFDFERITSSSNGQDVGADTARLQTLFGKLVQQIETDVENEIWPSINGTTDDSPVTEQLTLDAMEDQMLEQHESSWSESNDTASGDNSLIWNRIKKQGIPALEPVRHLLNTVRDGALNHTSSRHHHLLGGTHNGHTNTTESAAIETEEDRETVIDSTGFNFLELLGTIAGMAWGFLTNIQKLFAASSGSASAASSGSSSGGQ